MLLGRPAGSNVRAYFHLLGPGFGRTGFHAFSLTETLYPLISSQFDDAWGTTYVRELPPGHYDLYSWSVQINTGQGIRTISPAVPPPALGFEVQAGRIVYLGNFHARITWGSVLGLPMASTAIATIGTRPERDLAVVYQSYPQLRGRVEVTPLPSQSSWLRLDKSAPAAPTPAASQPG